MAVVGWLPMTMLTAVFLGVVAGMLMMFKGR